MIVSNNHISIWEGWIIVLIHTTMVPVSYKSAGDRSRKKPCIRVLADQVENFISERTADLFNFLYYRL